MKAKNYLMEYLRTKSEIRRLTRVRAELKDNAEKISCDLSTERVQSSKVYDQMSALVARMVDNLEELVKKEAEAYEALIRIEHTISKVQDEKMREVLTLRYTTTKNDQQLTWTEISDASHISERELFRIHQDALKEVQKIIRKK